MTARTSWWRENRWWLAVLPLALAAVAAASSYNVKPFWYDNGLRREIGSAPQGTVARVTQSYEDALGPTSRTFEVELSAVRTVPLYPYPLDDPGLPPDGVDAVAVHLNWKAEPDQVLRACMVSLVDDEGRRYDVDMFASAGCVPDDHGGPTHPAKDGQRGVVPDGEDRPPAWTTAPIALVPEGRTITQVWVWWDLPEYVSLSVS
jgi:hypothetical protein